jgi:undecaprenyl diphosphate synthase
MTKFKTAAIIMDENRRWAKSNNLPISHGHRKGIETLIDIVKASKSYGINKLIVYAFSTENWSRESQEVNALMNLINFGVDVKLPDIVKNEMKLEFIGDLSKLPTSAQKGIEKCVESTKQFSNFTLVIALNYGAIWDIVETFKKMVKNNIEMTESNFLSNTQISNTNVDIFIRTGGDRRLSNFLLHNLSYSELFFSDKLWPDFNESDLKEIIDSFESRQRRFGK